jgi:hypothetical protein
MLQHMCRYALEEKDRELEKCVLSLRVSEKDLIATKKHLQELQESLALVGSRQICSHPETSSKKGQNRKHEDTAMLNGTLGNDRTKMGSEIAEHHDVLAESDQQRYADIKGSDSADSWGEKSEDEGNSKTAKELAGHDMVATHGSQEQEHMDASMQDVANRDLNFGASDHLVNKARNNNHARSSEQEYQGTKSRQTAKHHVDADGVDAKQLHEALNDSQRQLEAARTKSNALERKVQELQEELHNLGKELAAAEEENEKDLRKAMAAIKAAEMAAESSLRIDKGSLLQVRVIVSHVYFIYADLSSTRLQPFHPTSMHVRREPPL